jgi:hypothetical protein
VCFCIVLFSDELGLVLSVDPSLYEDLAVASGDDDGGVSAALRIARLCADPLLRDTSEGEGGQPFILKSHKLGIAYWCIPRIVQYCLKHFVSLKTAALRAINDALSSSSPAASTVYSLTSRYLHLLPTSLLRDLLSCTRNLLCVNADHYTAWNVRKHILQFVLASPTSTGAALTPTTNASPLSYTIDEEIIFLNLLYSKHPKSGESWAHR